LECLKHLQLFRAALINLITGKRRRDHNFFNYFSYCRSNGFLKIKCIILLQQQKQGGINGRKEQMNTNE